MMGMKSNPLTPLLLSEQFLLLRNYRHRIDASFGVSMVGSVKPILTVLLALGSVFSGEAVKIKSCLLPYVMSIATTEN